MNNLKFVYKHYRMPKAPLLTVVDPSLTVDDTPNPTSWWGRHGCACHYQRGETAWTPSEHGGYTQCFVYDGERNLKATGIAECSPLDSFCYRIGRAISRGRALKSLSA